MMHQQQTVQLASLTRFDGRTTMNSPESQVVPSTSKEMGKSEPHEIDRQETDKELIRTWCSHPTTSSTTGGERECRESKDSNLPTSSKRSPSFTSRVSSIWNTNRKWQERRKWSAPNEETADRLRRESLVDEALRHDVSLLGRRPDQVSVTVQRVNEDVSWGCKFRFNSDVESIEIEFVSADGLLAIQNPCARYATTKSLLQPGDILESINGTSCYGKFLGDVQALLENLSGRITLVFSTSFNDTVQLCQTVAVVHGTCEMEVLRLCQEKQNLILQRCGYFDKWSVASEGDLLVAVGDSLCLSLTPEEASTLLYAKAAAAPYVSITTIKASPADRKWIQARKAAVALSGGALVGVGAILMASPLHPIGHAMAFGGVGVLGTEFDAPQRALQSARKRLQFKGSCSHDNDEEIPEMMHASGDSSATSMD